jgi:PAS domain S-box-containing protein
VISALGSTLPGEIRARTDSIGASCNAFGRTREMPRVATVDRVDYRRRQMVGTRDMGYPSTDAGNEGSGREATELRQSEARYRAVVEDQTELICRYHADGTFTFVNEAYCRYFKRSREQLLGNSFWEFIPFEWHAQARAHLGSITPDNPVAEIVHEVLNPNGEIRWQLWRDRGFFDDNGKIAEFQSVGCDITERVRMEQALRESEQQLKLLANHVPVNIWMNDESGCIQFMNARFLDYTGARPNALPCDWSEIVHPHDAGAFLLSYRLAFERRSEHRAHARLRRHDGEYHWFDVIGLPRFDGHRLLGYVGCSIDVTERRRAEQQRGQLEAQKQVAAALRDADRRKDEFLSILSHELRNPLAPIVMAIEILRSPDTTAPMFERARDVIGRQVDHLKRLVDDLLDVSRISRGTINVELTTLDLREVVARAAETSEPLIHAGKHELSIDLTEEPLLVRGDAVRLSQVVSNLLNNAAKYSHTPGSIRLTAQIEDNHAVLRVADTGLGIAADMLERVFDPFMRIDTSHNRPVDGLGLGLTLVKRLVELHSGRVEALSAGPGQGSEFVVRLPLFLGSSLPSERSDVLARNLLPEQGSKLRILIVDDNVDYAQTLTDLLKFRGHDVYAVHDGPSALDTTESMTPDLVLLDLALPGIDGLEVAERLRRERRCTNTLMVAVTAYGRTQDPASSVFDHHLVKPVDISEIERLIGLHSRSVARRPG